MKNLETKAVEVVSSKKAEVIQVGNSLNWRFAGGFSCGIDLDALTPEMKIAAAMHGLKQTISDAYSGEKDGTMCHALAQVRIDCLLGGEWSSRERGAGNSDLATAVAELTNKSLEEVLAIIKALDDKGRKALEKDARVQAVVARLKAERLGAKAKAAGDSLDSLLGGVV